MTMKSTPEVRGGEIGGPVSRSSRWSARASQGGLVSRRAFVEGAAIAVGGGAALSLPAFARAVVLPAAEECPPAAVAVVAAPAGAAALRASVVSFYMDRPYLDRTGTAEPYIAPTGARSGQPLAEVTDEVFFSRFPY
jgi:hypothetical protein